MSLHFSMLSTCDINGTRQSIKYFSLQKIELLFGLVNLQIMLMPQIN